MVQMLLQNRSECHIVSNFMSHTRLRQDQTCLNCGKNVHDRFCSYCGQENREPQETFWSLLVHFIEDIFHYDGKLFTTIKVLFLKPGYLSAAYLQGKRTVFLHPIRFYLFTSAFFFISLFYVFHPLEKYLNDEGQAHKKELSDPVIAFKSGFIQDQKTNPKSFEEYKRLQDKLPISQQDAAFVQKMIKQVYSIGKEYKNSEDLFEALLDTMLHKISTLLFVALPLLALILQLLFIRRKGFYYMHHGIFILNIATSLFLVLFVKEILSLMSIAFHLSWVSVLGAWLIAAWSIYYFVAFKRFYQVSWRKALLYFMAATFLQNALMVIVFFGLLVFSFFSL